MSKQKFDWEPPEDVYDIISQEAMEFIYEEAKDRLDSRIENGDLTTTRAYRLLITIIPLFLAASLYLINALSGKDSTESVFIISLGTIPALLVSLFYIVKVIMPRDTHEKGTSPYYLFKKELIPSKDEDTQMLLLLHSQITNMEQSIRENDAINRMRTANLKIALKLAVLGPPILIVILTIGYFLTF